MARSVALIGSGNAFFKDEGVGLYAAKYLKENYIFSPALSIIDGGTLGFRLMPLLQEYDEIIIVNTASEEEAKVGEISVKEGSAFLDSARIKKTANEVEIAEMLQICSLAEHVAHTTLVSIVPDDIISVKVGLSECMRAAWSTYIDTVLEILEQCGVKGKMKSETLSLDEVLHIFANPSIEHGRGF